MRTPENHTASAPWGQARLGVVVSVLVLASIVGCGDSGPPPRPQTAVGALCKKNSDCYNTAKKQVCAAAHPDGSTDQHPGYVCTRGCSTRVDCPVGFECMLSKDFGGKLCLGCQDHADCPSGSFCLPREAGADMTVPAKTCQAKSVPKDDFGKDCAVQKDAACNTARGFFCHGEILDDPDAYCTKSCTSDADCYVNMYCGTATMSNVPASSKKRCFLKTQCSTCRSDAECQGLNSLCVKEDNSERGYCTRPCDQGSSKPCTVQAASKGYLECKEVQKVDGTMVNACAPRYGRCYGAGGVCDPCRPHTPEDCYADGKKVNGRSCYTAENGEGMCLQVCSTSDQCTNPSLPPDTTLRCIQVSQDSKACIASSTQLTCWP